MVAQISYTTQMFDTYKNNFVINIIRDNYMVHVQDNDLKCKHMCINFRDSTVQDSISISLTTKIVHGELIIDDFKINIHIYYRSRLLFCYNFHKQN